MKETYPTMMLMLNDMDKQDWIMALINDGDTYFAPSGTSACSIETSK